MRPSKSWKRIMDDLKRPIIPIDKIIWDHKPHELQVGMTKTVFVAPNRAIMIQNENTFVLYFANRRLHGYELYEEAGVY